MRLSSLFRKTLIENLRDWKLLVLTLAFGPFFVVVMYFYLGEATQSPYRVAIVNLDKGAIEPDGGILAAGEGLIGEMTSARYPGGGRLFEVRPARASDEALDRLADDTVDLIVVLPENFSDSLLQYGAGTRSIPATVRTYGNPAAVNYFMAAVWSDMIAYEYAATVTGHTGPLAIDANTVGGPDAPSDFELYVPALLTFALIMLMFTAAASLIKEKDKGTILRLRLSNMRAVEWFAAVALVQIIVGLSGMMLTLLTAIALGYETTGSLVAITVIGLATCLSVIAISLLLAACLRTIFDLLTVGCFPFFILVFFSGGMFPLPPLRLFSVADRPVSINDILPTTHTVSALDRILNYDAGLGDVALQVWVIMALTVVFAAAGAWLFTRRHMRA